MVQKVTLSVFTTQVNGSIPGQETKIPQDAWSAKKYIFVKKKRKSSIVQELQTTRKENLIEVK